MKKVLSVFLCFVLLLGCLTFTACGKNEDKEDDRLKYIAYKDVKAYPFMAVCRPDGIDDDALFCEIPENMTGDVEIPSEHDGHPVVAVVTSLRTKSIGGIGITSLTVGDGVKYIDGFYDTEQLRTLRLPDSIKVIFNSFSDCPYIENIGGFTDLTLVKNAFNNCEALQTAALECENMSNSFSDCKSLESVELIGGSIRNSFDRCDALKTVRAECVDVNYSFNDCGSLNSAVTSGKIVSSFCNCPEMDSLTVTQYGETNPGFESSFNSSGLKALELDSSLRPILYMTDSFNDCARLETISVMCNVTAVEKSFNSDPLLTEATFANDSMHIIKESFCNCEKLQKVVAGGQIAVTDASFENCPMLTDRPFGSESSMTKEDQEKWEAEKAERDSANLERLAKERASERAEEKEFDHLRAELNQIMAKEDEYKKIFDQALKKLADDGAIPALSDKERGEMQFEASGDGHEPVLYDQSVRQRLYAEPDFALENVVLMDAGDNVYWLMHEGDGDRFEKLSVEDVVKKRYRVDSPYALDPADARYLIHYEGYITDVQKAFYDTGEDRAATSTVVFIIDLKTKEIVHMKPIGDIKPDVQVAIGIQAEKDGNLVYMPADTEGANRYIYSLID